jgi:hypothetical protein
MSSKGQNFRDKFGTNADTRTLTESLTGGTTVDIAQNHKMGAWLVPYSDDPRKDHISFQWKQAVGQRTFSERSIVISFKLPDEAATAEPPETIYVFLPDDVTVADVPSDTHISFSSSGNVVLQIPIAADATAVEVGWIDNEAQNTKEFLLLLTGVGAGVIGGVLTGFLFGSPRWRTKR